MDKKTEKMIEHLEAEKKRLQDEAFIRTQIDTAKMTLIGELFEWFEEEVKGCYGAEK